MTEMDLKLIKLNTSHYYAFDKNRSEHVSFGNRSFFDKFKRVDSMLTSDLIKRHFNKELILAHDIIKNNAVENIIIDYNGTNDVMFYHKAQLLLKREGYLNWTAYRSKTQGHLHIYIHKGHTDLMEAIFVAKSISVKLCALAPKQWRVFPSDEVPPSFNILVLPYEVYAKERGSSWSKHL